MNNIKITIFTFVLSGMSFLAFFPSVFAEGEEQLGIFEHLDEYISDDLTFTNELYEQINLKEAIDKPTVLCLVYYECPGICSPLLNAVAEVADKSDMQLGTDYQIFTVSFNPAETPALAAKKKTNYVKLVSHGDTEKGWHFFTGDSLTINRLLDEVGFKVKKEGKEYIHPASLIMLSPDGKITRYLHGSTYFLPFDLKMAVVEAAEGKSGPTINKVLNYCFSYDPEGKKYVFNVTKVSGTLILVLALSLLLGLVVKGNKKSKETKV